MEQNPVGMKCIKYMLFVSNFMFVMIGVLLITFGSTIKTIYYDFEVFMEDHYFSPAILTIAVGVIILLIAAFGCAAAIKESTCMVNLYAGLLLIALILEISASIAAYSMRANVEVYMADKMRQAMTDYNTDNETHKAVDDLQWTMNCCGVHNEEEWYMYLPESNGLLPRSCCNDKARFNEVNSDPSCKTSGVGCLDGLSFIVKQSSVMLGTGALCIGLVQILGIVFAVMLAKSIRRIKTERQTRSYLARQELYLQLARAQEKPAVTPVLYTPENSTPQN